MTSKMDLMQVKEEPEDMSQEGKENKASIDSLKPDISDVEIKVENEFMQMEHEAEDTKPVLPMLDSDKESHRDVSAQGTPPSLGKKRGRPRKDQRKIIDKPSMPDLPKRRCGRPWRRDQSECTESGLLQQSSPVQPSTEEMNDTNSSTGSNDSGTCEVMAEMQPPEKKRRAANFSEEELLKLITEVAQRRVVILGAFSIEVTTKVKDTAWRQVTNAVNSMSRVMRDVGEFKKKFRNFKSDVKKKAAKETRERKKTGGGKQEDTVWKPSEEAMLTLIEWESIKGNPGIPESEEPDSQDSLQPSTSGASHGCRVSEETRFEYPLSQLHTSVGFHEHDVQDEPSHNDPLPVLQSTGSTDQTQPLLAEFGNESGVGCIVEVNQTVNEPSNISEPETLMEDHRYSRMFSPPIRPRSLGQSRSGSPGPRSRGPSSRASPDANMLEMLNVQMEIRDTLREIASSLAVIADAAAKR